MATDGHRGTSNPMLDYKKLFWGLLSVNMIYFGFSTGHEVYLVVLSLASLVVSFVLVSFISKSKIFRLVVFSLLPIVMFPSLLTARDMYQQRDNEVVVVDTSTNTMLVDVWYSLTRVYETLSQTGDLKVCPVILIAGIMMGMIAITFQSRKGESANQRIKPKSRNV